MEAQGESSNKVRFQPKLQYRVGFVLALFKFLLINGEKPEEVNPQQAFGRLQRLSEETLKREATV